MQYLLSRASLSILKRLASERTLFAFDFDGTLSPIVDHPDEAGMREVTRDLLSRLAKFHPVVIVSGRARADLLSKLRGVKLARVIGNHGAETGPVTQNWRRHIHKWKSIIEHEVGSFLGVWVEDKGLSLAVHYRLSSEKAKVRRRVFALAGKLKQARVFGGKQVINVVVDVAPHKGEALGAERDRLNCQWVLFVGDDENDEAAFAMDGKIIPVRIGRKRDSHARYYLRSQAEIDKLLERLVENAGK